MRGSSRNHQFLSLPEIVSLYYLDLNFFLEMEMERRGGEARMRGGREGGGEARGNEEGDSVQVSKCPSSVQH